MIITIEGTDGSGKETQSKMLYDNLFKLGYNVMLQSFPNYESESSILVKKYLNGDFGEIDTLTTKQSSVLFSVDRMITMQKYRDYLKDGGILILDRYVSSNILHQASKIENKELRYQTASWIENFEYKDLNLPRPDLTIFLDMPYEISKKLRENRKLKSGTMTDIHEKDEKYLENCYNKGIEYANFAGWSVVKCSNENGIKSRDEIAKDIFGVVKKYL